MWRWRPGWGHGERFAYRFDYAIEAQPLGKETKLPDGAFDLIGAADRSTLNHRADGLFPPLIVTVWVDEVGRRISDSQTLDVLQEPYTKPGAMTIGGDYALNRSRIEAAYQYIPAAHWSRQWHDAEAAAVDLIQELPEVRQAVVTGLEHARTDSARRVRQLDLRATRATGSERAALESEVEYEEVAAQVLIAAIETPTLRLDSTGIVIVSDEQVTMGNDA